jgi:hypothetical protein
MKTVGAIPLIVLLLFTGINVSVSTHYCCGQVAGKKVSLTGEQASCGMENVAGSKSYRNIFATHCCDNVTSTCFFSSNYFPSLYSDDSFEVKGTDLFNLPSDYMSYGEPFISNLHVEGSPPGILFASDVLLSSICVFRI